ncbi:MAG TPA: hypothetical protein VG713_04845, partial [Pirellulales bacterium]|nr:hypothetical protein [Pirellulales bacterium]
MSSDDQITIGPSPTGKGFQLRAVQLLPQPREKIFDFFTDAYQLQAITPPGLSFVVTGSGPITITDGTI